MGAIKLTTQKLNSSTKLFKHCLMHFLWC